MQDGTDDAMALVQRGGLPDALRALVQAFPRAGWSSHANFGGLVQFWMDRHLMFRRCTALLTDDAQSLLDNRIAPDKWATRLSRVGGQFVGELHGHHGIEDAHYFPALSARAPALAAGFDLLDRDHHALDAELAGFVAAANAALQAGDGARHDAVGRFATALARLDRLLDRHLTDEEDLIVPILLRDGAAGLG
jgi:hemerythrin-like domain-containing protein